jgi:hypothetical protein
MVALVIAHGQAQAGEALLALAVNLFFGVLALVGAVMLFITFEPSLKVVSLAICGSVIAGILWLYRVSGLWALSAFIVAPLVLDLVLLIGGLREYLQSGRGVPTERP